MRSPSRGEIWFVDLDPTQGREQRGRRPALVVSADLFNSGRAGLVIVAPVTSKGKGIPTHIRIDPPEGGLDKVSFAMCEAIRSISKERLLEYLGKVNTNTMDDVEEKICYLLNL